MHRSGIARNGVFIILRAPIRYTIQYTIIIQTFISKSWDIHFSIFQAEDFFFIYVSSVDVKWYLTVNLHFPYWEPEWALWICTLVTELTDPRNSIFFVLFPIGLYVFKLSICCCLWYVFTLKNTAMSFHLFRSFMFF